MQNASDPTTSEGMPPEPAAGGTGSDPARHLCFRLIRGVFRGLGWRYKVYVPATVALSAIFLLPPRFLQFFTSGSEGLGDITGDRFVFMLAVFGISVAGCLWLAIFLSGLLREWLRLEVSTGLRSDVLSALHRTRIEALDDSHRGDWMTRVTSDLHECEGFLTDSIPDQIRSLTLAFGSAALFFFYSGPIALIPCLGALALAWFNAAVQRRVAPVLREARELEGGVFQHLIENYEGLRTIRSTGGEAQNAARMASCLRSLYAAGMRIIRTMAALVGINEFAGQIVVTLALTVAALALQGGELTAEAVLVYPFFINVFLSNAKDLAAATYDWNRFFVEGGRLASILYDESSKRPHDSETFHGITPGQPARRLAARGLEIGYGGSPPVISGMDFDISSGEIVAIMGPSGCGKSTLLESLAGLRSPREGSFTVHRDGHEPLTFASAPVFITSFVEQRPYLFVGTVRENLLLGIPGGKVADPAIWAALEQVELAEAVRRRGGLDSVLADRGLNLSEGQRYRLTLCRALLAGRPFLLLDEPFAALDEASIAAVVHAIRAARDRGAGTVIVTHFIPTGLQADRTIQLGNPSAP